MGFDIFGAKFTDTDSVSFVRPCDSEEITKLYANKGCVHQVETAGNH